MKMLPIYETYNDLIKNGTVIANTDTYRQDLFDGFYVPTNKEEYYFSQYDIDVEKLRAVFDALRPYGLGVLVEVNDDKSYVAQPMLYFNSFSDALQYAIRKGSGIIYDAFFNYFIDPKKGTDNLVFGFIDNNYNKDFTLLSFNSLETVIKKTHRDNNFFITAANTANDAKENIYNYALYCGDFGAEYKDKSEFIDNIEFIRKTLDK